MEWLRKLRRPTSLGAWFDSKARTESRGDVPAEPTPYELTYAQADFGTQEGNVTRSGDLGPPLHCESMGGGGSGFPARRWVSAKPSLVLPSFGAASYWNRTMDRAGLFPKLRRFWSTIRTMNVDTAIAHLANDRRTSQERLTLLGLSVRTDFALWVAPVLTLVVMSYLLVSLTHLAALPRTDCDELQTFPWIALYPGWLSGLMTYTSAVAFPLVANLLLYLGPRREFMRLSASAGALALALFAGCATLAFFVTREITRVRQVRVGKGSLGPPTSPPGEGGGGAGEKDSSR